MKVYIVDAKRVATGTFLKSLNNIHPAEYGSVVVKDLIEKNNIDVNKIDELICGNILSAGIKQNLGRQIAIKAGIPDSVCGYSLNMLCGSGIKAIMQGYAQIKSGLANIIIAGGAEAMSLAPYLDCNARNGARLGDYKVYDHLLTDALTDAFSGVHMGITAENIAEKYNITRQQQDEFAINSQQKALKAIEDNKFKEEIVPYTIKTRKGETIFDTDEYPNEQTSLEKLATLRPAFKKDGTVTAGNASGLNDGAAFVLLVSEQAVKEYNLQPIGEVVSVGQGGVDPQYMGLGPVPAIKDLLSRTNIEFSQVEILELNEAFAAQSLGVVNELAKEYQQSETEIIAKTNVNGGAIALGHPLGASGARITTSLVYEMKRSNYRYGIASLCIGGGMGVALLIKNTTMEDK